MHRSANPCPRTTGAASGFGQGIAKHYAEEGAKVLLCDINCEAGEKLAETSDAFAFQEMNVTKADDWKAAIDQAVQLWGKVDILVNNAGTCYTNKVNHPSTSPACRVITNSRMQSTHEVTEDEFEKVMAVNVKSVFLGSNAFIIQAKKQGTGGCIVNIASVGAHRPRPGLVWYNASKGAIANVSVVIMLIERLCQFWNDNLTKG
jgi:NAD(P)-dependent dehydrogenase (short-subunit alcohol dehydrogenase family)